MKIRPATRVRVPSRPYKDKFAELIKEFENRPFKSLDDLVFELDQDVNPTLNPIEDTRIDPLEGLGLSPDKLEALREYLESRRKSGI